MNIEIDEKSGFCFGVVRAVKMAETALRRALTEGTAIGSATKNTSKQGLDETIAGETADKPLRRGTATECGENMSTLAAECGVKAPQNISECGTSASQHLSAYGTIAANHAAPSAGRLVSLGDIVHNEQEMQRLQNLGLQIVAENANLTSLEGRTVLIRAHGEPPSTYELAENHGITLIDATCPVVAALQKTVASAASQGYQVVIFGHPNHAEVRGLVGHICVSNSTQTGEAVPGGKIKATQRSCNVVVIESDADLDRVDFTRPIYFLAQTTSSLTEFRRLGREIARRAQMSGNKNVITHDTVCRQVAGREQHLAEFARKHDTVIFVAGAKSSNGRVLFEVVEAANHNSHKIQDINELRPEWFEIKDTFAGVSNEGDKWEGDLSVGICGATSTPRWLMEKVASEIQSIQNK